MNSLIIEWLVWIAVGAVAGWIAYQIMHNYLSLRIHIVVGILGAFLGGSLLNLLGTSPSPILWSLLMAIIGSVLLLASLRFVAGRHHIT